MSIEVIYFTLITLLAHIVLTLRVYAITGKNKWVAGGLYGLSSAQFGIGAYLCMYSFSHPRACFLSLRMKGVVLTRFRVSRTTSSPLGYIPDVFFPGSRV